MPHIETLAVHAGAPETRDYGAVSAPIHLTTTFTREPDGSYPHGHVYARTTNPTRGELERCLAALEGGADAATFASGQAATSAVFQALGPDAHVIAAADTYYGTGVVLREIFAAWGLSVAFVDMTDLDALDAALANAPARARRLVWVETPSNPLLHVTDIAAVVERAQAAGALVACDNTWATPVLTRPLALGADLVMHSTTKYLGGHSDVTGGAVIARTRDGEGGALFAAVRAVQQRAGAVPSPFDCWLLLRGVRTLALRVRAQSANALAVARFLEDHPGVAAVHYPGLASHAGHEIAARQMCADGAPRYGGMLSVQIKGGREAAMGVVARCELFTRATSLGGVESLIEHRASNEHPETTTPQDLLRVSVGIEHADDLIGDLRQALGG
jgi:cystathionine gamma-synthase